MAIRNTTVDDRIRYYCTSHPTKVPTVTMHERRWAYCPGGYIAAMQGHFWTAIEPTTVSEVKPKHVGLIREQRSSRNT
jgi:hypothetical protein